MTESPGGASRRFLALDPGLRESGVVLYDPAERRVLYSNNQANKTILPLLERYAVENDDVTLAVEELTGQGRMVGLDELRTCLWSGRFCEAWLSSGGGELALVPRWRVKQRLLGRASGTDAQIRTVLLDQHGGKAAALGSKWEPGPLAGVTQHAWQALAVAVVAAASPREFTFAAHEVFG